MIVCQSNFNNCFVVLGKIWSRLGDGEDLVRVKTDQRKGLGLEDGQLGPVTKVGPFYRYGAKKTRDHPWNDTPVYSSSLGWMIGRAPGLIVMRG